MIKPVRILRIGDQNRQPFWFVLYTSLTVSSFVFVCKKIWNVCYEICVFGLNQLSLKCLINICICASI